VNRAPKLLTILVAAVLVVLGALGTFGDVFSDEVGAWLLVAASGVMILGTLFRGL
jgi:Flp pilus assembly protein TadB